MTHTKGPWYRFGPLAEDECGVAGGVPVDVVVASDEPEDGPLSILDDLSTADADLIAAAPDLLAALKAIEAYWSAGNFSRDEHLWASMDDAIRKAEGPR